MQLHRDVIAGTLFILIGAFALLVARRYYPVGSAMRMGPGYFPAVLGALLILLGAWVGLRAFRRRDWERIDWGWKPLAWITASMLLFGFLMPRFGMIPALAALFFVAAAAGREFRFREVLILTVLMCAFAGGVFVYGLKLPYRLLAF
jgi:putative tricarboxylic transport membrane protein